VQLRKKKPRTLGPFLEQRNHDGKGRIVTMYGHVNYNIERLPAELVRRFREIWTSTLCDVMGRHGGMGPEIRPINEGIRLAGTALTVLSFPADNITTHKALQLAKPGDVLVIDDGGGHNTAAFGHNMSLRAGSVGVVGVVTNGAIRDLQLLRKDQFPVFCSGVCPRSPQKNTPGSVNVPIQVGGVVVNPGDIVVGDDDGVAVVPVTIARELIHQAEDRMKMEYQQAEDIRSGKAPLEILHGASWVDDALRGKIREIGKSGDHEK
jgi:4-hydroxy-4-methyl-2-oxoglutarate aldolase